MNEEDETAGSGDIEALQVAPFLILWQIPLLMLKGWSNLFASPPTSPPISSQEPSEDRAHSQLVVPEPLVGVDKFA